MEKDTFIAGVHPGGLNDRQDIKILICFIFDKSKQPLKKNDITSILQNYGLANYFEASQAFNEMLLNDNICEDEKNNDSYIITQSGKLIAEELGASLPVSVREKAIKSVESYLSRIKSERENKVIIKKTEFGYSVICRVSDGKFDMLELKLYAPDILGASIIKDNFYKNPGALYEIVLNQLTRSVDDEE